VIYIVKTVINLHFLFFNPEFMFHMKGQI